MLITLDFETFYDREYSLSKLTTEEYIKDKRFEVIGVAVKLDNNPAVWFSGSILEIKNWFRQFDFQNNPVLAHNAVFDLAILHWVFGILPGFCLDTLSMSRPIHGLEVGGSLAKLSEYYNLGQKGNEVINNLNVHRQDFSSEQLKRYGEYCCNDVELTYKLFKKLNQDFPQAELELIHLTILMYVRPLLKLNPILLQDRLIKIKQDKQDLLEGLKVKLNCETHEEVRKKLCSNLQFAEVLKELHVPLPMKVSPSTGQNTLAFAKTDVGFIALETHPEPLVQQLCSARLGTKSTIEESRIERFLGISYRNNNLLPIPLKYCAAHTLRWGGSDKVNLQNLPSRDKDKIALKQSIEAPPGYVLVNVDSSQIEARWLAYLAGQDDLVEAFRQGRDIYSEFASEIFYIEVSKKTPKERHVGKTAILGLGYGTGSVKLQSVLESGKPSIKLSMVTCIGTVNYYRRKYPQIVKLWGDGDRVLKQLASWPASGDSFYFGKHELLPVLPAGISLPNGFYLKYKNLQQVADNKFTHESREGPKYIWGGVLVENTVQTLARITIGEQLRQAAEYYPLCLTVHDSGLFLVPEKKLDEAQVLLDTIFSTPPVWAPGVPLACEIKHGANYGEC